MILRSEIVEQAIHLDRRNRFLKDVIMTKGTTPLGLVRKRALIANSNEPVPNRATVVLVHGFGQNRYSWHTTQRSMANYLAELGFDVFNVDLRGHGRSRHFGAAAPMRIDDYIREDLPAIAHEVQTLSGQRDFFLVGHSMGGLIGYGVAGSSLRPYVRGIATLGAPYRFGRGSAAMTLLREFASFLSPTGILDYDLPLPIRQFGDHLKRRRSFWDLSIVPLPVRGWAPGSVEKPILEEYLAKSFEKTSLRIALDIFRAGQQDEWKSLDGRVDYRTSFEMLDRPLLVVAGTLDHLAPPDSVRPAYEASRSSDKTYRTFPAGHVDLTMGRDAPTTIWPLVGDWLKERAEAPMIRSGEYGLEA